MVINPQYSEVWWGFSEGLAGVRVGHTWGFIDKTGKMVINPQFDVICPFAEGLAPVQVGDTRVDIEIVGQPKVQKPLVNAKWGYIDKTGKITINPQFDRADWFVNGLAEVMVEGKLGYIDTTGKYVWKAN